MSRERILTGSRRAALVTLAVVGSVLTPACSADPHDGYSFKSTHSDNIRTVAVPVFDNRTYATGLELELTEAIIKEIQHTTAWTVTTSTSADVTLKGTVQVSDFRKLSVDHQSGLDEEVGVDTRIDFELVDNRSGKVLTSRKGFGTMDTFAPSVRAGERPEIGRSATVGTLARDIVAELRDTW